MLKLFEKIYNYFDNLFSSDDKQIIIKQKARIDELIVNLNASECKYYELEELYKDSFDGDCPTNEVINMSYWANKRKPDNSYRPALRPPLNGTRNLNIDPRIFFTVHDGSVPVVPGTDYDGIANNALEYVHDHIRYASDKDSLGFADCWLFSFETQSRMIGDCDDMAILLANMIIRSGVPAYRVRINAGAVKGGFHAYVTYLALDNTWRVLDPCYYYAESQGLKLKWKDAEKYLGIIFSFDTDNIYKGETLDR